MLRIKRKREREMTINREDRLLKCPNILLYYRERIKCKKKSENVKSIFQFQLLKKVHFAHIN